MKQLKVIIEMKLHVSAILKWIKYINFESNLFFYVYLLNNLTKFVKPAVERKRTEWTKGNESAPTMLNYSFYFVQKKNIVFSLKSSQDCSCLFYFTMIRKNFLLYVQCNRLSLFVRSFYESFKKYIYQTMHFVFTLKANYKIPIK